MSTTTSMRKRDLQERLEEALERIEAFANRKRMPKKEAEPAQEFVDKVRDELTSAPARASGGLRTFRVARVTSGKTGRQIWIGVNTDGTLSPSEAERAGVESAEEWREVQAESWAPARAAAEAGEGKLMRRTKGGKIKEVEPATA